MSERRSSNSSRSRTIKLFCPSLSKFVPWVILEDEKLDLGSIARTFGLEPSTLKINRHFISRGFDLISSSVTWKSLLSFFASRGLSTGTNDFDALIVDGKLCKSGTKRTHMPPDGENGSQQTTIDYKDLANHKKLQVEDGYMLKKRKMNETKPDAQNGDHQTTNYHDLAINRRPLSEDVHLLKKRKLVQNNSVCTVECRLLRYLVSSCLVENVSSLNTVISAIEQALLLWVHTHSNAAKEDRQTSHYKDLALNRRPPVEDVNHLKKRRITPSNSGALQLSNEGTGGDEELNLAVKRKLWLGDFNPLKKIKMY